MLHAGNLETTFGRAAAAGVSSSDTSFSKMSFSDLEATVRFFERSGLGIPDSFIDLLRAVIVYSNEFNFIIGGNSLADSFVLFCARLCSTEDPIPGPSLGGGGGSMLGFLQQHVGVTSSPPPFAVGANGMCLGDGIGSLGVPSSL